MLQSRIRFLLVFSLVVFFGFPGAAKNLYVRKGASGSNNGSDWNNAWTDVTQISWGGVNPGDSIWIAGGNYGTLLIGANGATNNPIYIARVRSTNSIPASAAGWNSAYDSQVVLSFYNNYGSHSWITLDGQVPYSGILITNTSLAGVHLMDYAGSSVSYSVTKCCDIGGACTSSTAESGETRCFNCNSIGVGNYFGYCQFHNAPTLFSTLYQANFMVEHCKLYSNLTGSTSTYHPNVWQTVGCTNVTVRYCEIYNWQAEGIMMDFCATSDALNVNWYIYGNVWHDAIGGNTGGSARIVESQYNPNGPVYLYNNTFVGMIIGVNLANGGSWNSSNASTNNIYIQTGGSHGFGKGHDDYDLSDVANSETHGIGGATSGIFVNFAAQNYQIVSNIAAAYPRNKAAALPAQYANDFNGNIRGADGAWDIGAYEYNAGNGDTTPPTVALTSPTNNATVSNSVTLNATATDNTGGSGVAGVTFLVDTIAVGGASASPYSITWNSQTVTNGSHGIQARAQDVAGNIATSSSITVTVFNPPDTTPPTVSLTAPVSGAIVSNIVTLSVTATDNTGGSGMSNVTFLVDGVAVGISSNAPYSIVWNSQSAANGSHGIQARAKDVAGNQTTSGTVTVTTRNTVPDTTPPSVNLTSPVGGAIVSNTVTLSATASDNTGGSGMASVTFFVDGGAVGISSNTPYSFLWNSQLVLNGTHTIQARAQDVAGNQTTSSGADVTVQNAGPTLTTGFVGYWPFDDASGTTAKDSSGNGNNGTLVGDATWGTGYLFGCLSLDGQSGYVRVPSTPNLDRITNVVTICAWVKFGTNIVHNAGDMQDVARKVISETSNPAPYSAYDLVVQDFGGGTFKARIGVTRSTDSTRGTSNWGNAHTYGPWYHLAGVYDGSTVQLYVNGMLESSVAFSGPILQTSQPLCIGRYGTVGEALNGLIDDLRLYNRALSAAEIQTLFNAMPPAAPSGLMIKLN